MKKILEKLLRNIRLPLRIVVFMLLATILYAGGLLAIGLITKYRPQPVETIELIQPMQPATLSTTIQKETTYKAITYNIGYAALGKEQDFFMDGGTKAGADSQQEVLTNLEKIVGFVETQHPDFALLQEVDTKAKRSFNINQLDYFTEKTYATAFALNYNTVFVPLPLTKPMGAVKSGIATLTNVMPTEAKRYDFAGSEPFPQHLFDLERAFTITRYPVADSAAEFVLINVHLSAFDEGGKIRKLQLEHLQEILNAERAKGSYVVLGGDFNHELPGTTAANFTWTDPYPDWCQIMDPEFLPDGYKWAVDGSMPTVRADNTSYVAGVNFVAVIDGFLVSDNIEIESVKTHGELDFENSDHNPVELVFKLK